MTGTQVLLLVVSETGLVYTFTTPKLQPLVTKAEGKNLIQVRRTTTTTTTAAAHITPPRRTTRRSARHRPLAATTVHGHSGNRPISRTIIANIPQACLNAPEPAAGGENGVDGGDAPESPEESPSHIPPPTSRPGMPQSHMPGSYMPNMPMDPQQALAYQGYMQRNQGYSSGMPQQPGMAPSSHHQS